MLFMANSHVSEHRNSASGYGDSRLNLSPQVYGIIDYAKLLLDACRA